MTKLRCPMSQHGVILRAFDEAGGFGAVAVILPHRSERWLRAATDPDVEARREAKLPYEDVRALSRAGVTTFVQDLAGLAGMYALPMPDGAEVPLPDLLNAASKLLVEAGEAVAVVVAAHADGVITRQEEADMKRELLQVMQIVTRILAQIDRSGEGPA